MSKTLTGRYGRNFAEKYLLDKDGIFVYKTVDKELTCSRFEDIESWEMRWPDLVLVNPPFNNAPKRQFYPEIFLRKITELFGTNIPVVLFTPMGLRLNQKKTSSRWQWARDYGPRITSIVSLPLDVFPDVKFHSEVLLFNVPNVQPHYWLEERYMAA